jgi:hypothetical protein
MEIINKDVSGSSPSFVSNPPDSDAYLDSDLLSEIKSILRGKGPEAIDTIASKLTPLLDKLKNIQTQVILIQTVLCSRNKKAIDTIVPTLIILLHKLSIQDQTYLVKSALGSRNNQAIEGIIFTLISLLEIQNRKGQINLIKVALNCRNSIAIGAVLPKVTFLLTSRCLKAHQKIHLLHLVPRGFAKAICSVSDPLKNIPHREGSDASTSKNVR